MKFKTPPPSSVAFEIPDEWWIFAEMQNFSSGEDTTYLHVSSEDVQLVSLTEIEPPTRTAGIPLLKKHRLVPILLAFTSPDACVLPAVLVRMKDSNPGQYRVKVYDGCHRYYASVAAGFAELPVIVVSENF